MDASPWFFSPVGIHKLTVYEVCRSLCDALLWWNPIDVAMRRSSYYGCGLTQAGSKPLVGSVFCDFSVYIVCSAWFQVELREPARAFTLIQSVNSGHISGLPQRFTNQQTNHSTMQKTCQPIQVQLIYQCPIRALPTCQPIRACHHLLI